MADHTTTIVTTRPRPALLRALGKAEPPFEIIIDSHIYQRIEIYKHDSWAATSLYSGKNGLVIAKFNRQQRIGFISMRWLGYWLARHEAAVLSRLQDLTNIPRLLGPVYVDGKLAPNAVARAYIPGHPMRAKEVLNVSFFEELQSTLKNVHARQIAYMDLHKRENVIVGEDGRPYLIDFQVSFLIPTSWWAKLTPLPWLLKLFQRSDDYHCHKHLIKHSDLDPALAKKQLDQARPFWIKMHRWIAVPIRELRRKALVLFGVRRGKGRVETEAFAEDALRDPVRMTNAA